MKSTFYDYFMVKLGHTIEWSGGVVAPRTVTTKELASMYLKDTSSEITYGYCHCGCGQKTNIANQTRTSLGWKKGEPIRFILGHAPRSSPIEYIEADRGYISPCWIWQRSSIRGYGRSGKGLAHAYMYEKHVGKIPEGTVIDHLCKQTMCCNPSHLEPVTNQVNVQRSSTAKLNPEKVRKIRSLSESMSKEQIAREFGVSTGTVHDILIGRTWGNV